MINIRKYQEKDKELLRDICIKTSRLPIETEDQRKYLTLMYNDYYTEVEGRNCFVAVDENDVAVGYILCAENFARYSKIFRKFYLPEIKKLGMNYYFMAIGEMAAHLLYSKKYPAHLHIDILDVCQGQGVGTRLMNELKNHLKSKNVPALMLSCGGDNTMAVKFYKKNSFKVVKNLAGSYIMGIDL
ncbi:MAG: GNAT family N-acetyltransferase [Clostridia bacterium]|nr:GNAT family N-acetyltransferase [Clostridia bacterium]